MVKQAAFFQQLAGKSSAQQTEYLQGLLTTAGVQTIDNLYASGVIEGRKPKASTVQLLQSIANGSGYEKLQRISQFKTAKKSLKSTSKIMPAEPEEQVVPYDPELVPLTPEQEEEIEPIVQLDAQQKADDAYALAQQAIEYAKLQQDFATTLSQAQAKGEAMGKAKEAATIIEQELADDAEMRTKEKSDRIRRRQQFLRTGDDTDGESRKFINKQQKDFDALLKKAKAKGAELRRKEEALGRAQESAVNVEKEMADDAEMAEQTFMNAMFGTPSPERKFGRDAMQIADTTAVAEAKAKERREEMLRPNPKAKTSQRVKTEEREYAREDTNKESRAKEVDKRRQALDRWSNDPEADTDDLLRELGFKKRQIDDNTNAQVKKAKKTLQDYTSAELTQAELFEMMDMLIDPPTQSPDERDAKPKAKEYVSSSGERRPMGERPVFRVDAKRQAEEAVQADKKELSMKKQELKERRERKARDAKVQEARMRMMKEQTAQAIGVSADAEMTDEPAPAPAPAPAVVPDLDPAFLGSLVRNTPLAPSNPYFDPLREIAQKQGFTQEKFDEMVQGINTDPEKKQAYEDYIPRFYSPQPSPAQTPRTPPQQTQTQAPPAPPFVSNPLNTNAVSSASTQAEQTPDPVKAGVQPVELAPTKAELIPKERLAVEGKSPQELLADIMYFFKNFAPQLKPIKAKWDKLSKRQKSSEVVLKRYHGEIVGRLQPEGSKADEGKEGKVGIVVDAEQYIEMKMREIMLDSRFANMQPAELVDVNEGIKKKQASDMGAFEVRQGLRGGKSFIQREPVYKAISTSQPDQLAVQMRPPGKATQPKRLSLMPAKQINLATTARAFTNANPFARSVPTITLKVLK